MKRWLACCILAIFATFVAASGFAAGPGPQVIYFQQRVSINAKSIPLSRLLRLWDEATGMNSSVPRELANQTVSVNFSELPLNEAVRQIFEKLPLDYVFTEAQGIIVTGRSQAAAVPAAAEAPPVYTGAPQVTNPLPRTRPNQQPVLKPPPPPPPIPTPFGPIPDSGDGRVVQLPPVFGPPSPPFFAPVQPAQPAQSPVPPVDTQNDLFRPLSIYPDPSVPPPGPPPK